MYGKERVGYWNQNALGGRYQDWAKATPLYQKWLNTILQSTTHVITTNRKKQGYNMITEGNKTKVEKAGLDDEIRDGYEYEMTIALEITNDKHMARASKDRTSLFTDHPEFVITVETGKQILAWCNQGKPVEPVNVLQRINECKSLDELLKLYYDNPTEDKKILAEFTKRRKEFEKQRTPASLTTQKQHKNGTYHSKAKKQSQGQGNSISCFSYTGSSK